MDRDYNSLLKSGNRAQLEKLKLNGHKQGFDNIDIKYAKNRMFQECQELAVEFYDQMDLQKIRHEAADIANFAHMIIYACDKKLGKI